MIDKIKSVSMYNMTVVESNNAFKGQNKYISWLDVEKVTFESFECDFSSEFVLCITDTEWGDYYLN